GLNAGVPAARKSAGSVAGGKAAHGPEVAGPNRRREGRPRARKSPGPAAGGKAVHGPARSTTARSTPSRATAREVIDTMHRAPAEWLGQESPTMRRAAPTSSGCLLRVDPLR